MPPKGHTLEVSSIPCEARKYVLAPDFESLLRWRRDVRHFLSTPVPPELIDSLLRQAALAPSVGFSQPWRWVLVDSPLRRSAITDNFAAANAAAQASYADPQALHYSQLKLAGLREAPVHLAVFADPATSTGSGLGRRTMPETLTYSVVMAIHTLWLAAQVAGLGLGWVSILDPLQVHATLDVDPHWTFVAYLCLGWPAEPHPDPLLERAGWESRQPLSIHRR